MSSFRPRLIQPEDSLLMANIVITCLEEFDCIGPGYASSDPELNDLYQAYQAPGSQYWVIQDEVTQAIVGGGGYAQLKGTQAEERICELQKLYFLPEARGRGYGSAMIHHIMHQAKADGYQEMYLESVPRMAQAIKLYEKLGFSLLAKHKGNTGHHVKCPIYMRYSLLPAESGTLPKRKAIYV